MIPGVFYFIFFVFQKWHIYRRSLELPHRDLHRNKNSAKGFVMPGKDHVSMICKV